MSIEELRLEILRLTYTHGREISEAVGRAKELEAYILQASPAAKPQAKKKADKPQA